MIHVPTMAKLMIKTRILQETGGAGRPLLLPRGPDHDEKPLRGTKQQLQLQVPNPAAGIQCLVSTSACMRLPTPISGRTT